MTDEVQVYSETVQELTDQIFEFIGKLETKENRKEIIAALLTCTCIVGQVAGATDDDPLSAELTTPLGNAKVLVTNTPPVEDIEVEA